MSLNVPKYPKMYQVNSETEWLLENWQPKTPFLGANGTPSDRFLPLALLILKLLREPRDLHPEGIICGAWHALCWMPMLQAGAPPTIGEALFEAGFVDLFLDAMKTYSAVEQIGRRQLVPTAMFCALMNVVEVRLLLSRFCGTFRAESPIYAPRNRLLLSRFHGTFPARSPMHAPRNTGLIEKVSPCRHHRQLAWTLSVLSSMPARSTWC
eukprot:SAG31_NODE_6743_length_1903_cov_1.521064_2_plen_210_part_00